MGNNASVIGTRVPRVTEHLDLVFGLLRRARRRYILYYLLAGKGEPVDVDELVTAIRTCEAGGSPGSDPPPRKELWIALYHTIDHNSPTQAYSNTTTGRERSGPRCLPRSKSGWRTLDTGNSSDRGLGWFHRIFALRGVVPVRTGHR